MTAKNNVFSSAEKLVEALLREERERRVEPYFEFNSNLIFYMRLWNNGRGPEIEFIKSRDFRENGLERTQDADSSYYQVCYSPWNGKIDYAPLLADIRRRMFGLVSPMHHFKKRKPKEVCRGGLAVRFGKKDIIFSYRGVKSMAYRQPECRKLDEKGILAEVEEMSGKRYYCVSDIAEDVSNLAQRHGLEPWVKK